MSDSAATNRDALQFDRALTPDVESKAAETPTVVCANCQAAITTEYFHVGNHSVCATCRDTLQQAFATPRGWGPFVKAALFGVAAAIAGAIIYYSVIALADLEIGIVAILIGYMVGYMVRKGADGRGGRRFQLLALVLTYWSVGLAYSPLAFKAVADKDTKKGVVTTDSTGAAGPDSAASTPKEAKGRTRLTGKEFAIGLGAILLMTFALPVIAVISSLPSGILSAIIILVGLRQAWRMTAAPNVVVTGPFKVGPASSPSTA